jgi:hypothetical protein
LLLRDIAKGDDAQVAGVVSVMLAARADIIALQGIDWDLKNQTLSALADRLARQGLDYPYRYALRPNTGLQSGFDLDLDGRLGEPEDAHGYGWFTGQDGMALLSRYPIRVGDALDFSDVVWADVPDAQLPVTADGSAFWSDDVTSNLRLSHTGLWVVPIDVTVGARRQTLNVVMFKATSPVFDGPEDRNGLRNAAELRQIHDLIHRGVVAAPFAIMGDTNMDPSLGEGDHGAMRRLLALPQVFDPQQMRRAKFGAGLNPKTTQDIRHADSDFRTNHMATVDWPAVGALRVDYVLPSRDMVPRAAGVFWPAAGAVGHDIAIAASRHRLVWVDVSLP